MFTSFSLLLLLQPDEREKENNQRTEAFVCFFVSVQTSANPKHPGRLQMITVTCSSLEFLSSSPATHTPTHTLTMPLLCVCV